MGYVTILLLFYGLTSINAAIVTNDRLDSTKVIRVHVVPHTHNDVGWLKTVDQYYYGAKNNIQKAGVQYTINTVIGELAADPEKTFIFAEVVYFKMWWEKQNKSTHKLVRSLIKSKQLEFVGGGYSINDEGSVHYSATIDQFSAGMVWLLENFGGAAEPTVAWQMNTYGHSAAQAALSAQSGLKGMFISRMHYQEYERRKEAKELEFMWLVEEEKIFTGVLYEGYSAPSGFCFDTACDDPPMVADPDSPEYNLPERLASILEHLDEQSSHYTSGHIMLTMGGDFAFQNAEQYFSNLDLLMELVNKNSSDFEMVYSTPSRYMEAVKSSIGGSLPQRKEDMFPYADDAHSYWTGYHSSRPALKGYVRDCNNMLQTCRQIEVLVGSPYCDADKLWLAMSSVQSHNGISGTSREHVTADYSRMLAEGQTFCEGVINRGLEQLSGLSHDSLQSCRLMNESFCELTSTSGDADLIVVVYNSRPVTRTEYIRIPLLHHNYEITEVSTNQNVDVKYLPVNPALNRANLDALPIVAVFRADIPGLGYSSYLLKYTPSSPHLLRSRIANSDITIVTDVYKITFDGGTGSMKSVQDIVSGTSDQITASFLEYRSNTGDSISRQASGAYVFRPDSNTAVKLGNPVLTNYFPTDSFSEVWQTYSDWLTMVTRVYKDKTYIEVEWVVGPIAPDYGREIIIRYETTLETRNRFYTDSNGREMIQRVLNTDATEPIAGNYYPVNTRAIMVDEERAVQLTILTDRSQGGSSLADGQLEMMLHRRILNDDNKGLNEPLNDNKVIIGRHWLCYSKFDVMKEQRVLGQELFYRPTVAIGLYETPEKATESYSDSAVNNKYINVLTVINVDYSGDVFTYLMRLENVVPVNEGGKPITVNMARIFKGKALVKFDEMGLAGDRPISHVEESHGVTQGNVITLDPLQIRTFFATYKPRNSTVASEETNETEEADRVTGGFWNIMCSFIEC